MGERCLFACTTYYFSITYTGALSPHHVVRDVGRGNADQDRDGMAGRQGTER